MPYPIETIETEWLNGSPVDCDPRDLVRGFAVAERLLGGAWIESKHRSSGTAGTITGSHPTLSVASAGWRLAAADGVPGASELLAKLLRGDVSAWAELAALYLCRGGETHRGTPELGPLIEIDGHERRPDFRLRLEDSGWTYVEVTAPTPSEDAERVEGSMQRIGAFLPQLPQGVAVEVFLGREPEEDEFNLVLEVVLKIASGTPPQEVKLPDRLGRIFSHAGDPRDITNADHGEDPVPRIGTANVRMEMGQFTSLLVRIPFEDQRAAQILATEARQLPKGPPGIVVVDMNDAAGGWKAWEPLIARRFQPKIHTRISGVVLFMSGFESGVSGERLQFHVKVIPNPHASVAFPQWIRENLVSFADSTT